MPRITETTVDNISRGFRLAGYDFGQYQPPVQRRRNGDGFQIRVQTGDQIRGSTRNVTYDYFETDATGLITASPRGHATEFNRRVRITDIAEVADRMAKESE